MVEGSRVTSPKVASTSGMRVFSPTQDGASIAVSLGTRTGEPSVSKMRGPAARKTLACSNGRTRIASTCSRVSSEAEVAEAAMWEPFGHSLSGLCLGLPAVQRLRLPAGIPHDWQQLARSERTDPLQVEDEQQHG